jgi:hypothetical protein
MTSSPSNVAADATSLWTAVPDLRSAGFDGRVTRIRLAEWLAGLDTADLAAVLARRPDAVLADLRQRWASWRSPWTVRTCSSPRCAV